MYKLQGWERKEWAAPPGYFLREKMSVSRWHLGLQRILGSSNNRPFFELNSVYFPRRPQSRSQSTKTPLGTRITPLRDSPAGKQKAPEVIKVENSS